MGGAGCGAATAAAAAIAVIAVIAAIAVFAVLAVLATAAWLYQAVDGTSDPAPPAARRAAFSEHSIIVSVIIIAVMISGIINTTPLMTEELGRLLKLRHLPLEPASQQAHFLLVLQLVDLLQGQQIVVLALERVYLLLVLVDEACQILP